jgi:preprotein translocase subunit SecD
MQLDAASTERVKAALTAANIAADSVRLDGNSIKVRFLDTETQLKAKDAIQSAESKSG